MKYLLFVSYWKLDTLCLGEASMRSPRGAFYYMYFCFVPKRGLLC